MFLNFFNIVIVLFHYFNFILEYNIDYLLTNKLINMSDKIISEKDKNLDKVFWFKVISGCAFGVGFGAFEITGFLSFLLFICITTILSIIYFRKFVCTDEDVDYQTEIFTEGINVTIPLFLLLWITTYTFVSVQKSEIES